MQRKLDSSGRVATKRGAGDRKLEENESFWTTYAAEVVLLAKMLVTILIFIVCGEFMMDKVCSVNLGYSDEVCAALNSKDGEAEKYQEEGVEVQKMIGSLMMAKTFLENLFPLFLVILIGAWSDKYGRKLPMLFVVGSFVLQNVALLLCVYFKNSVGGWTVVVVTSLIPGLSGNLACFNMAAFSYIAQNSPPEKLTARTGVAHSMLFLGLTVGLGLGGFIARSSLGFANIFLIGLILEGGIFIYILFALKDHPNQNSKPFGEMFLEIFNFQHITDSVQVVRKPRPGNTRTKLFVLLMAHFFAFAPIMGEMTVYFLFARTKFNWDGAQMGMFLTYKNIIGFFGNFVTMGLLTQKLKLPDPLVGICGIVSTITASLYFAGVDSGNLLYFGPILGLVSGANMIVPRSILSKIIPAEELGKVSSFLGAIESIAPLLAGPIYSMVYTHSFEVFPGTFFLLTAFLNLPPLFGYLYFLSSGAKPEVKKN